MRYRPHLCVSTLFLLVAGCTTVVVQTPTPPPPAPLTGSCVAEAANRALGQSASDANVERATLDAGAKAARVIRPGQAITEDFSPDRLNIHLDERDRIVRLNCG